MCKFVDIQTKFFEGFFALTPADFFGDLKNTSDIDIFSS